MKVFAGFLAIGLLWFAPHTARAALSCVPQAHGEYFCTQSIVYDGQYVWEKTRDFPTPSSSDPGTFRFLNTPHQNVVIYDCANRDQVTINQNNPNAIEQYDVTITSGLPDQPIPVVHQVTVTCRTLSANELYAYYNDQAIYDFLHQWYLYSGTYGGCGFYGAANSAGGGSCGYDLSFTNLFNWGWYLTYDVSLPN
jgi:hypothetical protein